MEELVYFSEKNKWNNIVDSFSKNDIYFKWEYLKPFKDNGDGEPALFYYEDENGRVANIFFKRDISENEFFKDKLEGNKYFDISTQYGYGGPLYEGGNISKLAERYSRQFTKYCLENNIISDFIRFNPVINNKKLLEGIYNVEFCRNTVYIDLSKNSDFIWNDFKSRNRTSIRKAIKSGMKIIYGKDDELIDKTERLYYAAMDKNGADKYYYFNKEFFQDTIKTLFNNSMIVAAELDGEIIASSIFLYNSKYIHYHLNGSLKEYGSLCANNLILYEVAKWGCNNGKKILHLGGGYSSGNDDLFKFKSAFSKNNRLDFFVGKKVHDKSKYEFLIKLRNDINLSDKYFPIYRSVK